jgi:hypothetical protein
VGTLPVGGVRKTVQASGTCPSNSYSADRTILQDLRLYAEKDSLEVGQDPHTAEQKDYDSKGPPAVRGMFPNHSLTAAMTTENQDLVDRQ